MIHLATTLGWHSLKVKGEMHNPSGVHCVSLTIKMTPQPPHQHEWSLPNGKASHRRTPRGKNGLTYARPTTLRTRWFSGRTVVLTMPATATPITSISVTTPTQDQYVSGERQHVCETITCNTPRNKIKNN